MSRLELLLWLTVKCTQCLIFNEQICGETGQLKATFFLSTDITAVNLLLLLL